MTTLDLPITATTRQVTLDLYRDIHKAIRVELFDLTATAGRIDPDDRIARAEVANHLDSVVQLLVSHAEHEDGAIQPVLEIELPELCERIEGDHLVLEARMEDLRGMASEAALAATGAGAGIHRLYLALAGFTSDYLAHQDLEERVVMPALEAAVGVEAVVGLHQAIIGSIPPDEMARSLALMLPAMNVHGRTELLGGMQAGAPPEVFQGVWSLAASVLEPTDVAQLAARLGIR